MIASVSSVYFVQMNGHLVSQTNFSEVRVKEKLDVWGRSRMLLCGCDGYEASILCYDYEKIAVVQTKMVMQAAIKTSESAALWKKG